MREDLKFPFENLAEVINSIDRPDVPDIETIFERVRTRDININEEGFRRLMYLLQRCEKLLGRIKKIYSTV